MSTTSPSRTRSSPAQQPGSAKAAGGIAALDYPLIAIMATLLALGLIEVYSASFVQAGSYFFRNQVGWVVVGLVVLVVMAAIPYRLWQRLAVPVMALALLLLIAVLLFGKDMYGARRTLLGGRLQPSEFVKLAVVVYVAAWVASKKKHLRDVKAGLVPFAIVMGVVAGLVVLEKSFSVTIIILVAGITIFFLGGGDVKQLIITAAITAIVLLLLIYQFRYGVTRIEDWWKGLTDPGNAPYSVAQVHEIIRRGGGIGTRPENWLQKGMVPLLWSDYLFANLAADFKFVGGVSVVVLFAALGYRGLSIALNAPDQFGALTSVGITTWLMTQALIHMGTSVALIPATGIPLPFMSYGGSAMMSCMAGMGLLLSISRAAPQKKAGYESLTIGWGNGRPRVPDSGRGNRPDTDWRKTGDTRSRTAGRRPRAGAPRQGAKSGNQRAKSGSGWTSLFRKQRRGTRDEAFLISNDWRSRFGEGHAARPRHTTAPRHRERPH